MCMTSVVLQNFLKKTPYKQSYVLGEKYNLIDHDIPTWSLKKWNISLKIAQCPIRE